MNTPEDKTQEFLFRHLELPACLLEGCEEDCGECRCDIGHCQFMVPVLTQD